jgi:predicted nucleotidyltransferase
MSSTPHVPTIDVRKRISPRTIRAVANRIARQFRPQRIVLFGSYAYGSPRPESDVDLLVLMDTTLKPSEQAQQIRQYLKPLFGLDLLVYTPEQFAQRLDWGDSFLQEVAARGKVLYESPDA